MSPSPFRVSAVPCVSPSVRKIASACSLSSSASPSRSSDRSTAACSFSRIASRRSEAAGGAARFAPSSRRSSCPRDSTAGNRRAARCERPPGARSPPALAQPSRGAPRLRACRPSRSGRSARTRVRGRAAQQSARLARARLERRCDRPPLQADGRDEQQPADHDHDEREREADRDEDGSPEQADRTECGQSSFVLRQVSRHRGFPLLRDGLQPYLFAPTGGAPPAKG